MSSFMAEKSNFYLFLPKGPLVCQQVLQGEGSQALCLSHSSSEWGVLGPVFVTLFIRVRGPRPCVCDTLLQGEALCLYKQFDVSHSSIPTWFFIRKSKKCQESVECSMKIKIFSLNCKLYQENCVYFWVIGKKIKKSELH